MVNYFGRKCNKFQITVIFIPYCTLLVLIKDRFYEKGNVGIYNFNTFIMQLVNRVKAIMNFEKFKLSLILQQQRYISRNLNRTKLLIGIHVTLYIFSLDCYNFMVTWECKKSCSFSQLYLRRLYLG